MKLTVVQPLIRDKQESLDIIDALRKAVECGEVVAFAAIGIGVDDSTYEYIGNCGGLSSLRFVGAVHVLQSAIMEDM